MNERPRAGGDAQPARPATGDVMDVARAAVRAVGSEALHAVREAAVEGSYAPFLQGVPVEFERALGRLGMQQLYAHQREAIDAVGAGRDVLITTGTASGKSLAYQWPIFDALLRDEHATALALYPTKALAADQSGAFARFAEALELPGGTVASYDGDTPRSQRPAIRGAVRTLLTNPDMLHAGILPHHTNWRRFFAGLRFIVVDEVHVYRGVFGGHLAGVLRRLQRVARHYGASPQVLATSATLGNPREHASTVLGRDVVHVARDAAPKPERGLLLVRPPLVDEALGIRRPSLAEAASLARHLAEAGRQVLMFAGSRQGVEEAVVQLRPDVPGVRSYRSGLLATERRGIEAALRSGEARIVVATNALELGIDVGGVDAVVIAGYPGSSAAFRQQVGRAGRRDAPGIGMLVLGAGPLDQYLARRPELLFGAPSERALSDPDHLLLALDHLRCATFELPLERHEAYGRLGPGEVAMLAEQMRRDGEVHVAEGRTYWLGDRYPAESVSLRSAGRDDVTLVTGEGTVVGTVDGPSARWLAHPGAVYLHDGVPYDVTSLDLGEHVAHLQSTRADVVTRASRETTITPVGDLQRWMAKAARVALGEVTVTETVTGYRRLHRVTRETLGRYPLDVPPSTLLTRAYAFAPDEATVEKLRGMRAWSNDENDYGPDWPQVRRAVLERDAFTCRHCGAKREATAGRPGTPLHVHHLVPFRAFATAREANRKDNLVTLCPSCHRKAERAVQVRSGLAAVAYALRSLAPLHVMADARDLGVHVDPASAVLEGAAGIVVFETVPGGVGLADALAEVHASLLDAAHALITTCGCEDGCPSCVGPAGEAGHAGKQEAVALLEALA